MTDAEAQAIRRENDYLKLRNAQLQADLTDLSAETERLRQALGAPASARAGPFPIRSRAANR